MIPAVSLRLLYLIFLRLPLSDPDRTERRRWQTIVVAREVLYEDDLIELDHEGITLRRYYFPLATSKRISYTDILGH